MPRAVLKNGVIQPLEPLPAEWQEGQELRVEPFSENDWREPTQEEFEQAMRELEEMCAQGDAEEDERLMQAMVESNRVAKEWMRRHMGLA
jgi:hypothetical protein